MRGRAKDFNRYRLTVVEGTLCLHVMNMSDTGITIDHVFLAGGDTMVRIEQTEPSHKTEQANAFTNFDAYARHPGSHPERKPTIHHNDTHLGMGNAYDAAQPNPNSHCFGPCEKAKNWHPNAKDHSAQAEDWRQRNSELSQKPLDVDKDGKYHVQKGDGMDEIVDRALKDQGVDHPTDKQRAQMKKDILHSSEEDNPTLKCNPELLKPGMKLTVPGSVYKEHSEPATPAGTPGDRQGGAAVPPDTRERNEGQAGQVQVPPEGGSGLQVHLSLDGKGGADAGACPDKRLGQGAALPGDNSSTLQALPYRLDGTDRGTTQLLPYDLFGNNDYQVQLTPYQLNNKGGLAIEPCPPGGDSQLHITIPGQKAETSPAPETWNRTSEPATKPEDHWYNHVPQWLIDSLKAGGAIT